MGGVRRRSLGDAEQLPTLETYVAQLAHRCSGEQVARSDIGQGCLPSYDERVGSMGVLDAVHSCSMGGTETGSLPSSAEPLPCERYADWYTQQFAMAQTQGHR